MLREIKKSSKAILWRCCHKDREVEAASSPPPEQTACSWWRSPARTEALSCGTHGRLTATLPGPHCTVYSISTEAWRKQMFFFHWATGCALPSQQRGSPLRVVCPLSPPLLTPARLWLCSKPAVQSSCFPGQHCFLTRKHPPTTTSEGARGWQMGPASSMTLLQFSF